ncbi:MAG: KOW domain-containing RNA-binding protein [Eubacterium sp.]|nr:KOW domain-containing RNA-binding protein [Eubacterium sp.]
MTGMLVISHAGHDKNRMYFVIGNDGEFVMLCDGKYRKLSNPKRKNIKHVTPVKNAPSEILQLAGEEGSYTDEGIKRAIKTYAREHKGDTHLEENNVKG